MCSSCRIPNVSQLGVDDRRNEGRTHCLNVVVRIVPELVCCTENERYAISQSVFVDLLAQLSGKSKKWWLERIGHGPKGLIEVKSDSLAGKAWTIENQPPS
jgi:hypothetical protein